MTMKVFPIILILTICFGGLTIHYLLPKLIIDTKGSATKMNIVAPETNTGDRISFVTQDSISIAGIFTRTAKAEKGTVILLHGIRGYKEHFKELSFMLADSGYNTLAIDLRAHHQSEGEYCTFGYNEKYDVQSAVDYLLTIEKVDSNIGIWGQSLGGAIAIQSLALEPGLKFGIVESTFSDFNTIVRDYATNTLGFRIPLLNDYLIYRAGVIAGFEPEKIKPSLAAATITQPVLIAHGTKDRRIKISYGKEIFDNLASTKKQFVPVENATHIDLWQVGAKKYFETVDIFLNSLK